MKKKKIYIAGGGGMLGEAFYRKFRNDFELKVTDKDVNESWISYLDFRDEAAYRLDVHQFAPDYLFHLGAYTDLEFCERNPEEAYLTNTRATGYAVNISNELNIPMLYIGTGGIFDGSKNTYLETDEPKPMGQYALTKYLGEKYVIENKEQYLVCRAGWMIGGGPKDKKFVGKILNLIRQGKKELYIVNDRFGTPTYTHDFAANVKELLLKGHWGLYNMVCSEQTSRIEVARELIRILGRDDEIRLVEVPSDHFSKEYFAPRPVSERLINAKLEQLGMNHMRGWKTCLGEYVREYHHDLFHKEELV
jgi:dTDP-4-dehydrorhamnose reductase